MNKKEKILDVYFQTNSNYEVRTEMYDGKEHLVVPVTMMVEGVHSGSHGPILHYADELGRYPESWDGIPVTIGHPKVNGVYVSANSPEVLSDWAVGRIFNTYVDDENDALKAEAWLCIEDLERVSEDTLGKINNNEIIEVSVGVFSDEEETSGIYNNEAYIAIARNHRPNHLALLPDEIGACSIEDGCGVRVNKKGGTKVTKKAKSIVTNENRSQVLRELNRNGFSVNEMGQLAKSDIIREAVYSLDGNGKSFYVEEIFDEYVIYTEYDYNAEPRKRKMYQQTYEEDAAGQINLVGEAVQVKKDISYIVVGEVQTNQGKTKRTKQKNEGMCTECVKKLADGLIANKMTAYSEDHREQLEAMSEEMLEMMSQNLPKEKAPAVNSENAKPKRADIISVLSESPLTQEEYLKTVAPEVREQMEASLQLHAEKKANLVKGIMDNTKAWEGDELKAKEVKELQKIYSSVNKEDGPEFAGAGGISGGMQANASDLNDNVMLPPGVEFDEK